MRSYASDGLLFHLAQHVLRAIPTGMRGKPRISRLVARPFFGRTSVRIRDRFGNHVWCPSLKESIALTLFADGVYEPETIKRIVAALPQRGVYLDVGANIGTIALAVAALRPDARIVCVEGVPELADLLRRNVADNKRSNVTVIETIAGSQDHSSVPFYVPPRDYFGMGSIGPQFRTLPRLLPQRSLDAVLDETDIASLDVVKMDIEGAELDALRGMPKRLCSAHRPVVIFEFADWAESRIPGQSSGDAQRLLISLGYRLFRLETRRRPETPLAGPLTQGAAMLVAVPAQVA